MPTRAKQSRVGRKVSRKAAKPPRRNAVLLEMIKQYRQKRAVGAKFYGQADTILETLVKKMTPGKLVPLDGGVFACLTDLSAGGLKWFKPLYVSRYELQIVDSDGKPTRLRDRSRTAKPAAHGSRRFF